MVRTCARQSLLNSSSTAATPTAQASALAMKVGPCMSAPGIPELMVCAIRPVHRVAAKVM